MLLARTRVLGVLGALALGTVATSANAGYGGYDSDDRYGDDIKVDWSVDGKSGSDRYGW